MRVISLGWGVQSFTLAVMAALGDIEPVDAAIHGEMVEGKTLSAALLEWATTFDIHDDRGDGVCTCYVCQVFAPMADKLERRIAELEAALKPIAFPSQLVAVSYDLIDKVVNDGDMREEARAQASEALERLYKYAAELEAAARPVPFSERWPKFGQNVIVWNGKSWFRVPNWSQGHVDDYEPRYTHWLLWEYPPAPESQP